MGIPNAEVREIVTGDLDAPGRRPLETGHDHEQRGLARPAGSDDGDRIAGGDRKAQIAQDGDVAGTAGEGKIDIRQLDDGFGSDDGHSISVRRIFRKAAPAVGIFQSTVATCAQIPI